MWIEPQYLIMKVLVKSTHYAHNDNENRDTQSDTNGGDTVITETKVRFGFKYRRLSSSTKGSRIGR